MTAVGKGIIDLTGRFLDKFGTLHDKTKPGFLNKFDISFGVKNIGTSLKAGITEFFKDPLGSIKGLGLKIGDILTNQVAGSVKSLFSSLSDGLSSLGQGINQFLQWTAKGALDLGYKISQQLARQKLDKELAKKKSNSLLRTFLSSSVGGLFTAFGDPVVAGLKGSLGTFIDTLVPRSELKEQPLNQTNQLTSAQIDDLTAKLKDGIDVENARQLDGDTRLVTGDDGIQYLVDSKGNIIDTLDNLLAGPGFSEDFRLLAGNPSNGSIFDSFNESRLALADRFDTGIEGFFGSVFGNQPLLSTSGLTSLFAEGIAKDFVDVLRFGTDFRQAGLSINEGLRSGELGTFLQNVLGRGLIGGFDSASTPNLFSGASGLLREGNRAFTLIGTALGIKQAGSSLKSVFTASREITNLTIHPFSKGGSNITTTARLDEFKALGATTYGNPRTGLYIAPKDQIDNLLLRINSRRDIEVALGLPENSLSKGRLVRIDVDRPFQYNFRQPTTGNEFFRQGAGQTTGGLYEALIDAIRIRTKGVRKSIIYGI